MNQRTLAEPVSCGGIGLHTGARVQLALQPARADSGIVFARCDRSPAAEIRVCPTSIAGSRNATRLAQAGVEVSTVEHLLAAVSALRIDNLRVELDGPEVPDPDGCALAFARLLRSAGSREQPAPRRALRLARRVELHDGARWIAAEPAEGLQLRYAIDFDHPAIGAQELALGPLTPELFERELAGARTFGFLAELPLLQREGLARGGDLGRVLVLDERALLNPGGLRYPDEFVRHKLLDLVGDLALLGRPLEARVRVSRGGHALHHALVAELASLSGQEPDPSRS